MHDNRKGTVDNTTAYIERVLERDLRRNNIDDGTLLKHLLTNPKPELLQVVHNTVGKKMLDFMLRKHLASCIIIKPYPEPEYKRVRVEIVYHGDLQRILHENTETSVLL